PGARGAAEARVRALGREGGSRVRCRRRDRFALGAAGVAGLAPRGSLSRRSRSPPRRGACGAERDEPHTGQFLRHAMTGTARIRLLALVGAALSAACGGARGVRGPAAAALTPAAPDSTTLSLSPSPRGADSVGALVARAEQDSAADQQLLDSLHRPHPRVDSLEGRPPATSPIKGEEVEREAERLFGLPLHLFALDRRRGGAGGGAVVRRRGPSRDWS